MVSAANIYDGIKVTWNAVTEADLYYVYRRTKGESFSKIAETEDAEYLDTEVVNGKAYAYTVCAYDTELETAGEYDAKGIVCKCVAAPVISASSLPSGTTISWEAVKGASKYCVYRKTAGEKWIRIKATTQTSYKDTTGETGTMYYYTVRAYNKTLKTWSGYYGDGVPGIRLIRPTPQVAGFTSKGIQISWNQVPGAVYYNIYRKVSGGSWTKLAGVSKDTVSYTDETAQKGTLYYYTVRAFNREANAKSSFMTAGVAGILMAAPTVTVKNDRNGITVSWSKVKGATGYRIYRKTGSGSWKQIKAISDASVTEYTDTGAKSGTEYLYTVRGYNKIAKMNGYVDKTGVSSIWINYPSTITVKVSSDSAVVSWSKVEGATGYRIYRKTNSGSYEALGLRKGTTFEDTAIKKGNYYTYTVRAYKKIDGVVYWSGWKTVAQLNYYCVPSGDKITWIGDSYSVLGADSVYKYFPGADVYAKIGKAADFDYYYGENPSGLDILSSIVSSGQLRPYLVFALGTNASRGTMTSVVNNVMNLAGSNTIVMFVTARTLSDHRFNENTQLRNAVAGYPNALVADWAAVCQDSYFGDDAHLNSYDLWAKTIYNAFSN